MNSKKIDIKKIIKNGGATLNHKGQPIEKTRGFMVSLYGKEYTTTNEYEALEKVNQYLEMIKNKSDVFVGVWVDTGLIYIDLSIYIKEYSKALETGRENKQRAIYNLETKESIYLTYKKYYSIYKIIKDKEEKIKDYKLITLKENKKEILKYLNINKNTLNNIIFKSLLQFEKEKKSYNNYIIISDNITLEEMTL